MGSNYKGSPKEIIALDSYIKLTRCSESIGSKINRTLSENGFTVSQYQVLDVIYHLGPQDQKTLSEKLFKSGGNITLVIDNLEKRNIVKRLKSRTDRRRYLVHLTKAGMKKAEKLLPRVVKIIVKEFSPLSREKQVELQSMCKQVGLSGKKKNYKF